MNNATVALNTARPVSPASTSASSVKPGDETPSSKRFDDAMDAARADARKSKDVATDTSSHGTATTGQSGTAGKKADKKTDDDTAKKDDKTDGDTSIANTMLALIGVPPKVTDLASKALGTLKDAGGKAATAIGDPLGLASAAAGTDAAVAGAKDGLLAATNTSAGATGVAGTADAVSPFAALLAAQDGAAAATKDDDASAAADPTTSPMPLVHTPSLATGDGAAMQVQATQAATSPQFTQELGEQIAWMGSGQVKEARIKLHPEELGSMDVRVSVDGGKVNVAIMAQHPAAVHAVQQTLSQLDTMLAHHGLSLGQADVGQQQAGQGSYAGTSGSGQDAADDTGAATPVAAVSGVSRGLVDEVA